MSRHLNSIPKTNEIIKFSNGTQFGELALINNEPRAATVIACSDTHFFTIQKEDFDQLLMKIEKRKQEQIIQFLRQFSFF